MSVGRVAVGHPVDVASGVVFTAGHDFDLPGLQPLAWRRFYVSNSVINAWLGRGWTVPYFMRLSALKDSFRLIDEEGGEVLFPIPPAQDAAGGTVTNFAANMELRPESDHFVVIHWHYDNETVEKFGFRKSSAPEMDLSWIEDLAGHRVTVHYDNLRRPVRLIQELERRVVELSYNDQGTIQAVYLLQADGAQKLLVSYCYDEQQRLILVTDADGNQSRFEYDEHHRLIAETNPLGSTFAFRYNPQGQCICASGDDQYLERHLQYHQAPHFTRVTDSLGARTDYYLNPAGQVMQEVSPSNGLTTSEYDEFGRLVSLTFPDQGTQQFTYDELGNRAGFTDENGKVYRFRHNRHHQLVELTNPLGAVYTFDYDDRGNFTGLTCPLGRKWEYQRTGQGLVSEARTPGGLRISHRYEPALRWQESFDQLGFIQRIVYDERGNEIAFYDAEGLIKQAEYDALSRLSRVEYAGGGWMSFKWNALGLMTEREGAGGDRERWEYDRFGLLVAHTNALNQTMRFEYDTEGRLISVTNRAGESMTLRYDAAGNVTAETYFDGRTQKYEYDPAGNCVRIIKSDDRVITRKYDKGAYLIEQQTSDGDRESYSFDGAGNLIGARNNHSTVEFRRDILGRVIEEVQNSWQISYAFDADSNLISRQLGADSNHELRLGYDRRGRLTALMDQFGINQELRWDELDRLTERRFAGGSVEEVAYNPQRRLASQQLTTPGRAGIVTRRYSYDVRENLVSLADSRRGQFAYKYDNINRLVSVTRDGKDSEFYQYDEIGTVLATHRGQRSVSRGGQTLTDGTRRFEYDRDGCISKIHSADGMVELSYDAFGRLTSVQCPDGRQITYCYDALGRRLRTEEKGKRTDFIWHSCDLAAIAVDEKITETCFFLDREPLAGWQNLQRFFPVNNQIGAVQEVISEYGQLAWQGTMEAFGLLLSASGEQFSPFRFPGQYHDRETGFHYNFYRTYDPQLAAYLSPDPIGLAGGSDFYLYPRDPLTYDDPFGLSCTKHKGRRGEKRMDEYYRRKGYTPIDKRPRPRGIDGVYHNPNGEPPYIIAEAKYGSSQLSRTRDGARQMSDHWVDSPIHGQAEDRLVAAVGQTQADSIRAAAAQGQVGKELYHAPAGSPGSASSLGNYTGSGSKEVG